MPLLPVVLGSAAARTRCVQRHDVPLDSGDWPAKTARSAVRTALCDRAPEQLDDIVMGVNELVANAVEHTPGPLRLILEIHTHRVVAEVCDPVPDAGPVQQRQADALAQDGRGLRIVSEVAEHWFVRRTEDGKAVCAAFAIPPHVDGPDDRR